MPPPTPHFPPTSFEIVLTQPPASLRPFQSPDGKWRAPKSPLVRGMTPLRGQGAASPLQDKRNNPSAGPAPQVKGVAKPAPADGQQSGSKKRKAESDIENQNVDGAENRATKKRTKHTEIRIINGVVYDPVAGKTCRQCRQKTTEAWISCTKMILSGTKKNPTTKRCGAYYHIGRKCLLGRYGEDGVAIMAVEVPDGDARRNGHCGFSDEKYVWECPECRGICNCSICRKKQGLPPTGILSHHARKMGASVASLLASNPNLTSEVLSKSPKTPKPQKQTVGESAEDSLIATSAGMLVQAVKKAKPSINPKPKAPNAATGPILKNSVAGSTAAPTSSTVVPPKPPKPKAPPKPKVEPPLPEVTPISVDGVEGEVVGAWLQVREFARAFGEIFEIPKTTYRSICRQDLTLNVLANLVTAVIANADLERTDARVPAAKFNDILEELFKNYDKKVAGECGINYSKTKDLLLYDPKKGSRHREIVMEVQRCFEVTVKGGTRERLQCLSRVLDWILNNSSVAQNAIDEASKALHVQKSLHFQRITQHRRLMSLADIERRTKLLAAPPTAISEDMKKEDKAWDLRRKHELERYGHVEEWLETTVNPKMGGILRGGDFFGRDSHGNDYWTFGMGEEGTFEGELCNGKRKWRVWVRGEPWWEEEHKKLKAKAQSGALSGTKPKAGRLANEEFKQTSWFIVSASPPEVEPESKEKPSSQADRLAEWLGWWYGRTAAAAVPSSVEQPDPDVAVHKRLSQDEKIAECLRQLSRRAFLIEECDGEDRIVSEEDVDKAVEEAKERKAARKDAKGAENAATSGEQTAAVADDVKEEEDKQEDNKEDVSLEISDTNVD
ncbi:hypothetical protein M427DRAFT_71663 [Gonapodya prolifera JEL478]|uniref:Zinc-finger domain-containing protein n=1 Tax=Gonapodya prolifera (strain JEL478) TaxID=1344416 RepID=A0A139A8H5_GONPJ|nr:hypothetical protein M427DRAFT_71663 [Gonapodya prolifera JEL478]|eukprot:KXS13106.1 hypothetical protein M427DRAFT_71663 [Gonapodya prolifera JEL478]